MFSFRSIALATIALWTLFASNSHLAGQENFRIDDPTSNGSRAWDILNIEPGMRTPTPVARKIASPQLDESQSGAIALKSFSWHSDQIRYQNLMFEEPLVERHGLALSENRQVARSAINFFTRGALFPIHFWRGKHRCCDSNLGWGNQGDTLCPKCAGSVDRH